MNPYRILGVADNSPLNVCKKAWRALTRKYHPDNGGDAVKFDEVNKALELIESGFQVQGITKKALHHKTMMTFE